MHVINRLLNRVTGEQKRYGRLLWSLIILFILYPIMQELDLTRFWSLFLIAELLFVVYSVGERKSTFLIALALVTPAALGEFFFFLLETRETHWFSVLSVVVFLGYVVHVVFRTSVLAPGKVTADRVAGAISVYLLLGLLWSMAYGILSAANPGSFSGTEAFSLDKPGAQESFIYFSFVTLTTLGYGDMAPVSSLARSLAWVEAVFGQLYLAVTIARLVSLQVSHREDPKAEE